MLDLVQLLNRFFKIGFFISVFAFLSLFFPTPAHSQLLPPAPKRVLLFTRTVVTSMSGYRENNIAQTRLALMQHWVGLGYQVDTSEKAALFNTDTLAKYPAIVFLKTSGDIFNASQEAAFEAWLRGGGAFVGIHSVLDTERKPQWPFFGVAIGNGAWYASNVNEFTKFTVIVSDSTHLSTKHMPKLWPRVDEVYDFIANPRPKVQVLALADETTYTGGKMGADHPISWCLPIDKGRSWITALGHTTDSYSEENFLKHLDGGLAWALKADVTGMLPKSLRQRRSLAWQILPDHSLLGKNPNSDFKGIRTFKIPAKAR